MIIKYLKQRKIDEVMDLEEYRNVCMQHIHEKGIVVFSDDLGALQDIFYEAEKKQVTNSMSIDHVKLIAKAYFDGRRVKRNLTSKILKGW